MAGKRIRVICPECGLEQQYLSYKDSVKEERRKKCNRCGKSFNPIKQKKSKIKGKKDHKPKGFFTYSKR